MTQREAKILLMERLDDCLLEHAASITAGGQPAIKDVYELQSLSELHYYLKAEHEFTPAEVEALLSLGLSDEDYRKIFSENAKKVFALTL